MWDVCLVYKQISSGLDLKNSKRVSQYENDIIASHLVNTDMIHRPKIKV